MLPYLLPVGTSGPVGGINKIQIVLLEKFLMKFPQHGTDRDIARDLCLHADRISPCPFHKCQDQRQEHSQRQCQEDGQISVCILRENRLPASIHDLTSLAALSFFQRPLSACEYIHMSAFTGMRE